MNPFCFGGGGIDGEGRADSQVNGKVLIVAGEASGDLHGGSLALALQEMAPGLSIYGVGSARMRESGIRILHDSKEVAVVGIVEVLSKLFSILNVLRDLKTFIQKEDLSLLILIDFPDFNLRLARTARRRGLPVLYYISPQIWAWREGRVKRIAGLVDRMAVIFPFETGYYEREGVDVQFVGHPLVDVVKPSMGPEEVLRRFGLDPGKTLIGLLPGSRRSEVARILPPMIGAARAIREADPTVQFAIPLAPTLVEADLVPFLERGGIDIAVVRGAAYDLIHAARLVVVASGTATMEAALLGTPMVVVYRTSWISYLIGRMLVKVQDIAMVNIVAGRRIVPELIQREATSKRNMGEFFCLISDGDRYGRMKEELALVRRFLGEEGASKRVARMALEMIQKGRSPDQKGRGTRV